jgi:GntP family gluconate:H+ symporter
VLTLAATGAGAAATPVGLWPFAVLIICVALIIVLITVVKLHAFVALVTAGFVAGLLTEVGRLPGEDQGKSHWVQAIELTTEAFGSTAGKIAVVIGLAAIIGMCLAESGAADKIVRRFLAVFGEKRAGLAILLSSFVLSIPIFFDTFFMLVLPIARALAMRTGKNYVMYIMAICSAGAVTHGLLIPHPGPLTMAEIMKIDAGQSILGGLVIGFIPVMLSWFFIKRVDAKLDIPVRAGGGVTMDELQNSAEKPESELPSFFASIVPVLLPIALISAASTVAAMSGFKTENPSLYLFIEFIGNRNVALIIGTVLSVGVLMKQRGWSFSKVGAAIGPPLETGGVIILITAAGGAFGLMLRHAGVGTAIQELAAGRDVDFILLAWVVAAVIRLAQGSATVALLTTAAMIQPMMEGTALPYHPVYVFSAIAFGGMIFSWMNDSGFWVIGRLSGFTEKETLRTWSMIVTFNSVVGLLTVLVLSRIFPFN